MVRFLVVLPLSILVFGCGASGSTESRTDAPEKGVDINLTAHWNETHQTLNGFGASDAWTFQSLGDWAPEKKERIADLLLSRETDKQGHPRGIGLSIWRFNIGAGSAEQGAASGIENSGRRVEGFLQGIQDGELVFDWSKQREERRFLRLAKERGVPTVIGFVNSPPVEMTRNGKAFGNGGGTANLADDHYDDFARFLAEVAKHFRENGLGFDYVSPVNEPQWNWSRDDNQEGSPYTNAEFQRLVEILNDTLSARGLPTRIELPETAQIDYLYKSGTDRPDRDDQIGFFFEEYELHHRSHVAPKVAAHSYFTTWPLDELIEKRERVAEQIQSVDPALEYGMSEYCILADNEEIEGPGRDLGMDPALYVARVIHVDLTVANASSWQWWRGASGGDYKDGLVYLNRGTKEILESKLLWGLGNYSRFLRPGAVRVEVTRSDETTLLDRAKSGLLASAYQAADGERVVFVLVNQSGASKRVRLRAEESPVPIDTWQPYVTRESTVKALDRDLEPVSEIGRGDPVTIPPKSIVTLIGS